MLGLVDGGVTALHLLSRDRTELCTVRRIGVPEEAEARPANHAVSFSRMLAEPTPDKVVTKKKKAPAELGGWGVSPGVLGGHEGVG